MFISSVISSFGVFFAGILTEMIGAQWAVGGLAIMLMFFSIYVIAFVPRIRKLD